MDPRFKFIRGGSFQGLGDYFEANPIRARKRKIIYPIKRPSEQTDLFIEKPIIRHPEYGLRVRSGYFYELLSQALWGGKVKALYQVESDLKGSLVKTEPDVSDLRKYLIREVKSMDSKGIIKLNDDQIFKYFLMQTKGFFKISPTIIFDIYRYGFSGLQSKYNLKKLDNLVKDLTKNTKFMISMPFSLIFQIYKNENGATSRYEGEAAAHHTRFLSKGINELLAYPEHTLEKLGISIEDYLIEKRKSPKRINVNGNTVNQFPILIIKDKLPQEQIKVNLEKEVNSSAILSERFVNLGKECAKERDNSTKDMFEPPIPKKNIPF